MLAAGDKITTLDHSLSAAPPGIASPNFGGNQRSSETLANLPIEHIIVARHARPLDATMSYTRLYEHETVQ